MGIDNIYGILFYWGQLALIYNIEITAHTADEWYTDDRSRIYWCYNYSGTRAGAGSVYADDDPGNPLREDLRTLCRAWLKSYQSALTLQEFLDKST